MLLLAHILNRTPMSFGNNISIQSVPSYTGAPVKFVCLHPIFIFRSFLLTFGKSFIVYQISPHHAPNCRQDYPWYRDICKLMLFFLFKDCSLISWLLYACLFQEALILLK